MIESSSILAVDSVRELFEGALKDAIEEHVVSPKEATAAYLVDLLCTYALDPPTPVKPLSALIVEAQRAETAARLQQLKRVGDHSLYVAGYFGTGPQLDLEYYDTIGKLAYGSLAQLLKHRPSSLVYVFAELGEDFCRFVELLGEVRSRIGPERGKEQIASLYERWVDSGGEALKRRLQAAGVQVDPKAAKRN